MGKFNLLTTLSVNAAGLDAGMAEAKTAVKEYAGSVKKENEKVNLSFRDVATMGLGEMRKELRALRNISWAGKTQAEIDAINERAGELYDTMEDLRVTQEAYGAEFGAAMASGLQTVSAIGEVALGAASMFGASEEQAKKYQQAMVQLIGVTQALGVIENAMQQKQLKTIAIKIKSVFAIKAEAAATTEAAAAQRGLNLAMLAIPVVLYATAIAALAAGIYYLVTQQRASAEASRLEAERLKALNDIRDENLKRIEETAQKAFTTYNAQTLTINKLVKAITDESLSLKEKKKALNELIALDPTYLKGLTASNITTEVGKTIIYEYIAALQKKAEAEAMQSALSDVYLERFKNEQKIRNAEIGLEVYNVQLLALAKQKAAADELGMGGATQVLIEKKNEQIEAQKQKLVNLNSEQENYSRTIDTYTKRIEENTTSVVFNAKGINDQTKALKEYKDELISVPEYQYAISEMASKGLPSTDNRNLGSEEGVWSAPEFDYEFVDYLKAQNDQLFNTQTVASLASASLNDLSNALIQMAETGEISFKSLLNSTLSGIRQIIFAKLAESIAKMIAGESSKGLVGLATAAIGITGIQAMFAKLPKFEHGGIVPGSMMSGDMMTARVNSGEMILNKSQQARLFNLANGVADGVSGMPQVRFIIEGEKLVGVIDNYSRRIRSGF